MVKTRQCYVAKKSLILLVNEKSVPLGSVYLDKTYCVSYYCAIYTVVVTLSIELLVKFGKSF